MLERRYEFFISSTFKDLQTERRFVQEEVIRRGHIPVGMELFDPGYEDQWNVIKKAIDGCDYYVVIIAARYGSVGTDDVSYTEKEFEYAMRQKKPVIVYLLADDGMKEWNLEFGAEDTAAQERLASFRRRVAQHGIVNFWNDRADLKDIIRKTLFSWMERHPRPGWVRAEKYEEVGFKRDVYTYLFNQLNPFEDVRLTEQFIKTLDRPLTRIDNVLYALNYLIKDFVMRQVRPEIRVYFAFPLRRPVPMQRVPQADSTNSDGPTDALYCFGISSERRRRTPDGALLEENPWMEGYLAGRESNIANVFRLKQIITIRDARRPRNGPTPNQVVPDEGSVIGTPVLYGKNRGPGTLHSLGVVGLSSPIPEELDTHEYLELAEELQSLFSALFYAYGQKIERERGQTFPDGKMAARLRREIADHYERTFGGNYPNLYRPE